MANECAGKACTLSLILCLIPIIFLILTLHFAGKKAWPELLGGNGDSAAATIEKENKKVDAIVLKEGTSVTKDFRCNRVWVWVDDNGHSSSLPLAKQ